jgi:hypothetical protein
MYIKNSTFVFCFHPLPLPPSLPPFPLFVGCLRGADFPSTQLAAAKSIDRLLLIKNNNGNFNVGANL